MVATLALVLLLNGSVAPRLSVHLSIDQGGGLSERHLELAIDEVRKIWADAGVAVTSGRYGEPCEPNQAAVSLRILLILPPVKDNTERILAWVTPGPNGRSAPLLFVSLPAVTEMAMSASAYDVAVGKLSHELRGRLIAQAVGRVAAHELGHYLLQNAAHQDHGLMRARYSAMDLMGDWLGPFKVPAVHQLAARQEIDALARLQAAVER